VSDADFPGRQQLLDSIGAAEGMSRVEQILDYYRRLPRPALARCPYSNAVVHHSVDTGGIDGPWWDYQWPLRPAEELPPTFFAFTGALRLGSPLPSLAWLVKPGPEVPFVVPRLLSIDRMRAVLQSISVGGWDGWTITYFTDKAPEVERFNDWGACRYSFDALGVEWDSVTEDAEPLDFDLAPWIDRGALLWIAPGDGELRLQSTPAGCPYLGLQGRRTFVRVQEGESWEPVPAAAPAAPA
jgi:hypothetical protein